MGTGVVAASTAGVSGGGAGAAGGSADGAGATSAGTGAGTGAGTAAGGSGVALGARATLCRSAVSGTAGGAMGPAGLGGTADSNRATSSPPATDSAGASVGDAVSAAPATLGGSRSSANSSAADCVRRYPAVYTVRTAAELKATRLFEIFLLEPPRFLGARCLFVAGSLVGFKASSPAAMPSFATNVEYHPSIMDRETQISALVSCTTSDLLERPVRATDVKKRHVVELALRHAPGAIDFTGGCRGASKLLVTKKCGEMILKQIQRASPHRRYATCVIEITAAVPGWFVLTAPLLPAVALASAATSVGTSRSHNQHPSATRIARTSARSHR